MLVDRFGFQRFSQDYHDVITAGDVDLVLVLTSMPQHGPITRAALKPANMCLVEKPMAVTLEEAAADRCACQEQPGLSGACAPCCPESDLSSYLATHPPWRHRQALFGACPLRLVRA